MLLTKVKSTALWTSAIATAAVLITLAIIRPMPLPAIVAALALVSVGAGVVGALLALSFDEGQDH